MKHDEGGDMIQLVEKYSSFYEENDSADHILSTVTTSTTFDFFEDTTQHDFHESITRTAFRGKLLNNEASRISGAFDKELLYIFSGIIFIAIFGIALWFYVKN